MDTILLLINNRENQHLLTELLGQYYHVKICHNLDYLAIYFDLLIIDGLELKRYQQQIIARIKQESPVFLPVLLLTNRQDVSITTSKLWQIVNDLIIIPVGKQELQARVENLLRSRRLYLELQKTQFNLAESQQEVEELQQELERLNQLFHD